MIVKKNQPTSNVGSDGQAQEYGAFREQHYSDAGGLTQFGAHVYTLEPGSRSADSHWHEQEDEFLYALTDNVTVVEGGTEHLLSRGDAACWPAGVANPHYVVNRAEVACRYLIVGTRITHDICHYPDKGQVLHTEGNTWRIVDESGKRLAGGKTPWAD